MRGAPCSPPSRILVWTRRDLSAVGRLPLHSRFTIHIHIPPRLWEVGRRKTEDVGLRLGGSRFTIHIHFPQTLGSRKKEDGRRKAWSHDSRFTFTSPPTGVAIPVKPADPMRPHSLRGRGTELSTVRWLSRASRSVVTYFQSRLIRRSAKASWKTDMQLVPFRARQVRIPCRSSTDQHDCTAHSQVRFRLFSLGRVCGRCRVRVRLRVGSPPRPGGHPSGGAESLHETR